jgi:glycosyltransferase involved in cell wall biosynthesis
MRILVITDLYPIDEDEKYTPRTIQAFVKSWEDLGHEVRVIKPNFLLNSFLRKKPYYKTGFYGKIENINYFLPFLGDIKKKIKTLFAPDFVVAHMPSGIIFANKLGVSFSAAVHASDIEVLTNPLYRCYFKSEMEKAYKNAKCIACRSYVLRNKFLELYPQYEEKTFVAPSGIDENIVVKREWKEKEKTKVLTCGQFIKRKNIDKVIKACEKFDNIELTVIGSGRQKLEKLSSKPIFLGQIPHDKVLEKMRESDIFILPSEKETFGMVYLEAMASGCITVCSKNDGIDGIIKDGKNGFLCEDVEEVLNKIINFEDKNSVLENSYQTILDFSNINAGKNYINYLTLYNM